MASFMKLGSLILFISCVIAQACVPLPPHASALIDCEQRIVKIFSASTSCEPSFLFGSFALDTPAVLSPTLPTWDFFVNQCGPVSHDKLPAAKELSKKGEGRDTEVVHLPRDAPSGAPSDSARQKSTPSHRVRRSQTALASSFPKLSDARLEDELLPGEPSPEERSIESRAQESSTEMSSSEFKPTRSHMVVVTALQASHHSPHPQTISTPTPTGAGGASTTSVAGAGAGAGADPLPPGCAFSFFAGGDDDDITSRASNWSRAAHCSHAGLSSIPPLPADVLYLHLGRNHISAIGADDFALQTRALSLRLKSNKLTYIAPTAFRALSSLILLDLNWNHLTTLPSGLFAHQSSLQKLLLSNNFLSVLPSGIFANLTSLTILLMSSNNLTSLPSDLLTHATKLTSLSMNHNQITSLDPSQFATQTMLVTLDLQSNMLTQLPVNLFANTAKLIGLLLSGNAPLNIQPANFNISGLIYLYLSNCGLSSLTSEMFLGLDSLEDLQLMNNSLLTLPEDFFEPMTSIECLYLAYNGLIGLPEDLFAPLTQVLEIYLDENALSELPAGLFASLSTARILDLSANNLISLPTGLFDPMFQLEVLYLDYNDLTQDELLNLGPLPSMKSLDLSYNQVSAIGPYTLSFAAMVQQGPFQGSCVNTCLLSDTAPVCPSGTSMLNISLFGNPISSISKTAFDTLSTRAVVVLSTSDAALWLPTCCGFEWLLSSPFVPAFSSNTIHCNRVPLSNFRLSSACTCKTSNNYTKVCSGLLNYTWTPNGCSKDGCPPGYRLYRTGSAFSCSSAVQPTCDVYITLFETACQECWVSNCSECSQDLTGCQQCMPYLLLQVHSDGRSICDECPLDNGYFINATAKSCDTCPDPCATCRAVGTDSNTSGVVCTGCDGGYGLVNGQCRKCSDLSRSELPSECPKSIDLMQILPPIFGGVALLILIGVLIWRRMSTRLKNKLLATQEEVDQFRKAWEIEWSELTLFAKIGKGAMGDVYRGRWRGMTVAVKVLRATSCEDHMEELDREASMLRLVRHAHIVQFFGAGRHGDTGAPFIVTELMELGSLTVVLRRIQLEWNMKIRFSRDIAAGMELVHSLGRMHRDLKSGNILVTRATGGGMRIKIADFGTATILSMAEHRGSAGGVDVSFTQQPDEACCINGESARFAPASSPLMPRAASGPAAGSSGASMTNGSGDRENHAAGGGSAGAGAGGSGGGGGGSGNGSGSAGQGGSHANVGVLGEREWAAHTKGVGTPLWMAPEILAGESYGSSADVYSYAIVLWEIASQAVPWVDVPDSFVRNELLIRIRRGDRPAIDPSWPPAFVQLLQECWSTAAAARPTFHDIMGRFIDMGVGEPDEADENDDPDDCLAAGVLVPRPGTESGHSNRSKHSTHSRLSMVEPLIDFPSNTP